MTNPDSLSNIPRLTLFLSSNSTNASQKPLNDCFTRRISIDQCAVLGSLYDARKDDIVTKPSMEIQLNQKSSLKPVRCYMIKGNTSESENLLDIIGINGELWLSLVLNIKSSSGIGSLVDYPLLIDRHTRFLYYYYPNKEKHVSNDYNTVKKSVPQNTPETIATHIVTTITLGICVIIVSQLPSHNENDLDHLFNKICQQLIKNIFEITNNEIHLLDKIHSTKIYSNIIDLTYMTKLTDVCRKIINIKPDKNNHCPLEYGLRPINWLYHSYPTEKSQYIPVDQKIILKLQQYLSVLLRIIKPLMIPFDSQLKILLEENYLKQQFEILQHKIEQVKELHSNEIEYIRHWVMDIRRGKEQQKTIDDIIASAQAKTLQNKIESVINCLNALISKAHLIVFLIEKDINYYNVEQLIIKKEDHINTIMRKIFKIDEEYLVFCSNDELRGQDSSKWQDIYQNWIKKHKNNRHLQLVYADFSYCSFSLTEIKLISSNDIEENSKKTQRSSAPSAEDVISSSSYSNTSSIVEDNPPVKKSCPNDQSYSSTISYINVVLLGESGVGKSTFINAFVNYLVFQNIDEAHSNEPIVLIPVSFIMTTGDNFEERIVKLGNENLNEDHNHSGQSVTQQCKSYVFNIDNKTKLRLIDTPGMGDTRGLDQDDINIDHIISYINKLEHINSICILLKPNQSRLNIVFRLYFDRLLKFLGSNARHNIIFCFTNTRSTFFSPGDTGPLLKSMIGSHQIKDIPFQKCNTFCFDSESFRYLIALQNQIQFDDYQKQEFKQSWIKSVPESIRMFKYISKTLKSYSHNQWKSIEHAKFHITQLIRPLLETIRNIYRNIILIEKQSTKLMINLRPEICSQFSAICSQCNHLPKVCGDFWIISDELHILKENCDKCQHDSEKHIMIDYKLEYELLNDQHIQSVSEMNTILDQINNAIQGFIHFFARVFPNSDQTDPILSARDRMINDENSICKQTKSNHLNSILHGKLIDLRNKHEETRRKSLLDRKDIDLNDIYTLIKDVNGIELVNKQMNIIKQNQQKYIEENQIEIPHKFILNLN